MELTALSPLTRVIDCYFGYYNRFPNYLIRSLGNTPGTWFLTCLVVFLAGCSEDNKPETYTIAITADGNGTAGADLQKAEAGSTVTLTATPNDGCVLLQWIVEDGDVTISDTESDSATFTMPAGNVALKAKFADENSVPYTVTVTGNGNGTAVSDKDEAVRGTTVTLTAAPGNGYVFLQWTVEEGDATIADAASNPATFTMPACNVGVKAEFIDKNTLTYTVTVTDDGNGTAVSDKVKAAEGTKVTLTATPKDGYVFDKWSVESGGVTITNPASNPATFTMPAGDVAIKAGFIKESYAISVADDGDGTAVADKEKAREGETVKLTATPKQGCTFAQWKVESGNVVLSDPTANPVEFTMPAESVGIKAEFMDPDNVFKMIPDPVFLSYCKRFDTNGDGKLSLEEAAAVKEIMLFNYAYQISTLAGIEYFTALEKLECNSALKPENTGIDLSKNTALTYLDCIGNKLTELDLSNNTALTYLSCGSNQLTSLDLSNNTELTELHCHWNKLTTLDLSRNTALKGLCCYYNDLVSLDLSNNKSLEWLDSFGNHKLTSLNVSNCKVLEYVECGWCHQLTNVNLSGCEALQQLKCSVNAIETLDISDCKALIVLNCSLNKLTSIDVSNNTALTELNCGSNKLTNLNISKNMSLTKLDCGSNKLTSLDVSDKTALVELDCASNLLTSLDISNNNSLQILHCERNRLTELDASNMLYWTNSLSITSLNLTCGYQTDGSSSYSKLLLTLRDDQKIFWKPDSEGNQHVVLAD